MKDEGQTFEELAAQARVLDEANRDFGALEREEATLDIVLMLAYRGNQETFDKLLTLTQGDSFERIFAVRILARLALGSADGFAAAESIDILLNMLVVETDDEVIEILITVLVWHEDIWHEKNGERIPAVLRRYLTYPNKDIRWKLANGLHGIETPEADEMLITLTSDENAGVRYWAIYGLGDQKALDTPAVRAAFVARLDDEDPDTRAEALYGLAERKDVRVVPAVLREFDEEAHSPLFDALPDTPRYRLLPALYEMLKDPEYPGDTLELKAAIARCEAYLRQHENEN